MIADLQANKNLSPIVTELFVRGRKYNYFICFYITILFQVPKDISAMYYFIIKISNKR